MGSLPGLPRPVVRLKVETPFNSWLPGSPLGRRMPWLPGPAFPSSGEERASVTRAGREGSCLCTSGAQRTGALSEQSWLGRAGLQPVATV